MRITNPFIVDIRCRMATGADAAYFRKKLGESAPRSVREGSEPAFFQELDEAGIQTAIAPSGNNQGMQLGHRELPARTTSNDEQAQLQNKYPGRFIGVAAIDASSTAHDSLVELSRCVTELGLKVACIEPGRAPLYAANLADRRLYEFYSYAQELGVPIILQTSGLLGGKNLDYANPKWIDEIAEDFPQLTLICAHGCYPFVRESIAVAVRRRNVYLSPDLYLFWPGTDDWVSAVNRGYLSRNFMFGSGYPIGGDLPLFVKNFLSLGWNRTYLPNILYKNALRALGVQTDPLYAAIDCNAQGALKRDLVSLGMQQLSRIMQPLRSKIP